MTQNLQTDTKQPANVGQVVNRQVNSSEMWLNLPWKQFEKEVYRLQRRIYKASQNEDLAKTISLQNLLLQTYSARMISIRQVTQLNKGKKIPGIDGKKALTNVERLQLEQKLHKQVKVWKHQGLQSVEIPELSLKKKASSMRNGNFSHKFEKPLRQIRMLKITAISDRAWQCLVKLALEPAHEAWFHERSYGFRPGRSPHDAQKLLFLHLQSSSNGKEKRVIELDIEKCLDRLNYQTILKKVIAPQWVKSRLQMCLNAGVKFNYADQDTLQSGIINPLLANIALNGIEEIHPTVRYAHDLIFILKPEHKETDILKQVENFLSQRGMNSSKKKTKVTDMQTGFNFLGWHFVVRPNGKFISTPSKENYQSIKKKIKTVVNNSAYSAETKCALLASIVRGWRNYHKYCDMKKHNLWHINHSTWNKFIKQPSINRKKADELIRKAFPSISYSVNKFVNVKHKKSPFDGDLIYWSKRNSKHYDGTTSKILKANNYRCHYCNHYFYNEQKIELHHVDKNHSNWNPKNLHVLHQSCHDIVHHANKSRCRSEGLKRNKQLGANPIIKSGAICSESCTSGSN